MLITSETYRLMTGQEAPSNFYDLQVYVIDRLERALGIYLESKERSEKLWPKSDGRVYPRATPITSVPEGFLYDDKIVYLSWQPYGGAVTPITADGYTSYGIDSGVVPGFTSGTVDGSALQSYLSRGIVLTYTGGYTLYGSGNTYVISGGAPTDLQSLDCPSDLAEAVAWGIHTKSAGDQQLSLPHGVHSLDVANEYSISREGSTLLGADNFPCPPRLFAHSDLGGRCLTLASRYRRLA